MSEPTSTPHEIPAIGLLAELPTDIRNALAGFGTFRRAPLGEYVVEQGKAHHELVVVLSGTLGVSCHAHGDTIDLAKLGAGETVGEMNIIDPRAASADVVVEAAAELWSISDADFERFVESNPRIGYAVMKVLAKELCRRLRKNSEKMLHERETLRTHFVDRDY